MSINRAEEADLRLVVIDVKNVEFTDVLLNLLKRDSILVVNKSDLTDEVNTTNLEKFDHILTFDQK